MSTKYSITLSWNNEKTKFKIPVLPEKIEFSNDTKNEKASVCELGEIIEKGTANCGKYSWGSILPKGKSCLMILFKLMEEQTVVHLVVSGTGITDYCLVTGLKYDEQGGDVGTYNYSIELSKYKTVTVRKLSTSSKKKATAKTSSTTRVSTKSTTTAKTYTVKSGDCLWNIAQSKLGNGNKWTTLWDLNSSTIQKVAKSHGVTASKNNPILYSGTVLKLS